jgi:enolase
MIAPVVAKNYAEAMQMLIEIFNSLGKVVESKGYNTNLGDEGGYAPHLKGGNREALELISEAVQKAGYNIGNDIVFALDIAANELKEKYNIEYYKSLVEEFPIFSIEDPFAEDDWENWIKITEEMSKMPFDTQIVGDDLLVTNVKFLQKAIKEKAGNAILIKPNQVGTLSETIDAVDVAHSAGWRTIISHRSGETMDTTIAHIAVGLGTGQIKTGSVSQPERMAKYNELLIIEKEFNLPFSLLQQSPKS